MSEYVRVAGAGGCRAAGLGVVLGGDPRDPAAAEPGVVLAEEQRMVVVAWLVEAVLGEVGAQQRGGAGAERDVAGLAAFAGQHGQWRGFEPDVAYGQAGELGDPGRGFVEGGQQGRVAAAAPGGPVGCGEQLAGLGGGEAGGAPRGPFPSGGSVGVPASAPPCPGSRGLPPRPT